MAENADDVVPLEDLVKDQPARPPGAADAADPQAKPGEPAKAAKVDTGVSLDDLESILAEEDPGFAESIKEIQNQSAVHDDVEIDSLDLDSLLSGRDLSGRAKEAWKFLKRPREALKLVATRVKGRAKEIREAAIPAMKATAANAKTTLTAQAKGSVAKIKSGLAAFREMPRLSKLLIVCVFVMAGLAFAVIKVTLTGRFLPGLQSDFLDSFADVADQKFVFADDEPMDDFSDPLMHPEHVVLINRMMVNLRTEGAGNPMGLFEFYIEASTQEGAIELKDREVEVRDTLARTLEQFPYEELVTADGKAKLKVILRKNLNEFATKGRIRRVFFKTIVLKP